MDKVIKRAVHPNDEPPKARGGRREDYNFFVKITLK